MNFRSCWKAPGTSWRVLRVVQQHTVPFIVPRHCEKKRTLLRVLLLNYKSIHIKSYVRSNKNLSRIFRSDVTIPGWLIINHIHNTLITSNRLMTSWIQKQRLTKAPCCGDFNNTRFYLVRFKVLTTTSMAVSTSETTVTFYHTTDPTSEKTAIFSILFYFRQFHNNHIYILLRFSSNTLCWFI
jgi:hypothetical protein